MTPWTWDHHRRAPSPCSSAFESRAARCRLSSSSEQYAEPISRTARRESPVSTVSVRWARVMTIRFELSSACSPRMSRTSTSTASDIPRTFRRPSPNDSTHAPAPLNALAHQPGFHSVMCSPAPKKLGNPPFALVHTVSAGKCASSSAHLGIVAPNLEWKTPAYGPGRAGPRCSARGAEAEAIDSVLAAAKA
ncbi:hypothetical protein AHiyo1_49670 [Arthrobacter sp. Hiyo1]|nr:hypothetical protein AHiyo1_49670 [Arthrobacter sp. Hiyo1]